MKSLPNTPAFTQIQRPQSASFEELLGFFGSAPSVLTADERYHTTSKSTRKPGLKRIAKLPGLLRDLLDNVVNALMSYEKDLPDPNALFPFAEDVQRTSNGFRRDVHKDIDVQFAYEFGVAQFCAVAAATLEFQLSHWSANCLEWSTVRLFNSAIPGVRRDQALADGFLNMSDKGSEGHLAHPSSRERLILETFPVIAAWEFKNLNFTTPDGQPDLKARADVFHQMVN
ncbi:hypothetical protein C0995_002626 [Termitomyces sp. Mi166|nr:hypothetical protein C0995_002626 [Termitomyces sp. Mi166\